MPIKQTYPSAQVAPGTDVSDIDYIFDDSGLAQDLRLMGRLSISANGASAGIIAADPVSNIYGKVPLKDIGTAVDFSLRAPATANANTATIEAGTLRFSFRAATSALTIFYNDPSLGALSGTVILGRTI